MGTRHVIVAACVVAALFAPASSCVDPTAIDVGVTTNVPSADIAPPQQALIQIGAPDTVLDAPTTSLATNTIDAGSFGDLVVVPNGDDGAAVAIRVTLGVSVPTSQCASSPSSCIVASRTIRYVPHHKLQLDIELEASCLGIPCGTNQTCVDGVCIDDTVNTNDCDGGVCGPGSLGDGSVPDASAPDAVPDSTTACPSPSKICNSTCVDVSSDKANCGDCGIGCTGGTCTNGTCQLSATVTGTCLAVFKNSVYVMTETGTLLTVPTTGGPGVSSNAANVTDVTSIVTDAAYAYLPTSGSPTVFDFAHTQGYGASSAQIGRIALDDQGFAWWDMTNGAAGYLLLTNGNPVILPGPFPKATTLFLAAAHGTLYASIDNTQLCRYSSATSTTCLNSITPVPLSSPGGLTVSDPASSAPSVFVVENNSSILELSPTLGTSKVFATGSSLEGGLASDGTSVYVHSANGLVKTAGGPFTPVAPAPNAVVRCLALDSNSVYWLENPGGLFKHVK